MFTWVWVAISPTLKRYLKKQMHFTHFLFNLFLKRCVKHITFQLNNFLKFSIFNFFKLRFFCMWIHNSQRTFCSRNTYWFLLLWTWYLQSIFKFHSHHYLHIEFTSFLPLKLLNIYVVQTSMLFKSLNLTLLRTFLKAC